MGRHNSRHPVASIDRIARVNELLKRSLADNMETLGFNENGKIVSITRVHCCSSLKNATVYVSVLGAENEEEERAILQKILKRKSELQMLMSQEVILKYTPVLHFVLDHSVAEGDHVLELIMKMEDSGEVEDAGR